VPTLPSYRISVFLTFPAVGCLCRHASGMEDAHSLHLSLPPSSSTPTEPDSKFPTQPPGSTLTNYGAEQGADGDAKPESPAFFGVFDGHGGE
jgi:hypothetical protein